MILMTQFPIMKYIFLTKMTVNRVTKLWRMINRSLTKQKMKNILKKGYTFIKKEKKTSYNILIKLKLSTYSAKKAKVAKLVS